MNQLDEDAINEMIVDDLNEAFKFVVNKCEEKGMFSEFCRLKGYSLPKSSIEVLVDQATGRMNQIRFEFFEFVREFIFNPILEKNLPIQLPQLKTVQ